MPLDRLRLRYSSNLLRITNFHLYLFFWWGSKRILASIISTTIHKTARILSSFTHNKPAPRATKILGPHEVPEEKFE